MTDHVTKELTTHWNSKPFHPPALLKEISMNLPSPSHPSFYLHGCEIKAGVGRTGNEAMNTLHLRVDVHLASYQANVHHK